MTPPGRKFPKQPPLWHDGESTTQQVDQISDLDGNVSRQHRTTKFSDLQLPPIRHDLQAAVPFDGNRDSDLRLPPLQPHQARQTKPSPENISKMALANILTSQPTAPIAPMQPWVTQSAVASSFLSGHDRYASEYGDQRYRAPVSHHHYIVPSPTHSYSSAFAPLKAESRGPSPSTQPRSPASAHSNHRQYSPAVSHASSDSRSYRSSTSASAAHGSVKDSPNRSGEFSQARIGCPPPPRPPPFRYTLSIRQHPVAARACGFGERDRRVIDPPPILELQIRDIETGAPALDLNAMLALHCTLLSKDGQDDETELPGHLPDTTSTRRMMGSLVASPYQAKDEYGTAGTFFVFPDLSCRAPGDYRLKFKLLRIDPTNMLPGSMHSSVSTITSEVFTVYTAKDFPGMRASTSLLKALRRQGLNVGVKKGSEARKSKGKARKGVVSSESESEGEGESFDGAAEQMMMKVHPPDGRSEWSSDAKNRKRIKRRRHGSNEHATNLVV